MTVSVPSLSPAPWKHLRARQAFVTREPAPPRRLRRRSRLPVRLGVMAGSLALLFGVACLPWREPAPAAPSGPPPAEPSPAPVWAEVSHPFQAYDLAGGPYGRLPLRYDARRDHGGGAREDTLTYGDARPGQAFLRVMFRRHGAGDTAETSVFLDAARLAAGIGLAVTRSGLGTRLDSRFGPFEVAGVSVEDDGRAAACLAFRLADPAAAPVLALMGLACGTVERPIDSVTLACTINRLDLVSAGDDEPLRAIFVAAERRRRDGCPGRAAMPVRLGAAEAPPHGHGPFRGPI